MEYFKDFPKIRYDNELLIHAPIRFAFQKLIVDRDYNMWDYQIQDGQSCEYVAESYYKDGNMDWIIYLANRVIDPYHFWPLTHLELTAFIEKKYGSLENALSTWTDYKDEDGTPINELQYNPLIHTRTNAYEYEVNVNNNKRNIKLIDSSQANGFKQALEDYLVKESNQLSYYLQYNPQFQFTL